jgi:glycyl-tRNA synthetase (class II)
MSTPSKSTVVLVVYMIMVHVVCTHSSILIYTTVCLLHFAHFDMLCIICYMLYVIGCAVFTNLLAFWRQHFVLHEDMLEISSVSMTPEIVLQTSGKLFVSLLLVTHSLINCFSFLLRINDEKSGECYRADKLLEEVLDAAIAKEKDATKLAAMKAARTAAGAMKQDELEAAINKWYIHSHTLTCTRQLM